MEPEESGLLHPENKIIKIKDKYILLLISIDLFIFF